jgi:hypothetical protein
MPPLGAGPVCERTVAQCVDVPAHSGSLTGAERVGEAAAGGRIVHIGVWSRGGGVRARFRATTCASLIAYAEVACAAIEAGAPADAAALRSLVLGVHPLHRDRADLVAAAVRAALTPERTT